MAKYVQAKSATSQLKELFNWKMTNLVMYASIL